MFFGKKSGPGDKGATPEAQPAIPPAAAAAAPAAPQPAASNAAPANGAAAPLDPEQAKRNLAAAKQAAAAFGEIVTLLVRSSSEKHHSLADLEWMVIPAVARGQFALAEAMSKETGAVAPVGAVLWAFVSEDVDRRLSDLSAPARLTPVEWRSGDIPWVILMTGDTKVLGGLLQQMAKTVFKDKAPKMRFRSNDGKVSIGHLEVREKAGAVNGG
jgi:hemolysin-activating ACP:hemolysin acyltransferase